MEKPEITVIADLRSSLDIELKENISFDELRAALATFIHPLITGNFNKLVRILYRLDINEGKLKQLLADHPAADAGIIIADLILERQAEKQRSREQYRGQGENNIDENEKW
jgi:hypothetical protein